MKTIITGLLLITFLSTYSQTQDEKLQERQKNKVEIFSSDEKDNLQVFVAGEVDKMKLSEDLQDDYYMILGYHTNKMGRLDDKDAQFTEKEIISKFKIMVKELDKDMKEILTNDQFAIHKESFGKIITSVYNRNGWTN
ncbi:hypothetical protein [uncultured Aquimarina sp.]|uniref:hypothetical protein n=1 Tax=uncultured Aquimarina sp. TaxID=575652 RepID=UPI0026135FA4|nr:hypothetical protein [uncultured Aquimarina sp.]